MARFNVISQATFEELQLGAGVLLSSFDPDNVAKPADADIICSTTGGLTIACVPTISDLGTDIDNCPEGTAELQRIDSWDCSITTTALSVAPEVIALALGAATHTVATGKVTPRALEIGDFKSALWWVGEVGGGDGYVAVKLTNVLSTGGFSLRTTKDGKGNVALTLKGHTSLASPDTVPCEFYATRGSDGGNVVLNQHTATLATGNTLELTAVTSPAGASVTWATSNSNKATVSDGTVTGGSTTGTVNISATITVNGKNYSDVCEINVVAAS